MQRIASVNQDRGISPHRKKGAAVHLAAMRDAFAQLGAGVVALDYPDAAALKAALLYEHERHPFDLVYERYALGRSTAARFARDHSIPLVLEVNSPLADEQRMFRGAAETGIDREHDEFLFRHAACIIAVSSAVAGYARKRGAQPDAVMVCPNGIDTQRFNLRVDAGAVRQEFVPADTFVLGFHGRLRPWHGFDQLVAAFENLLDRDLPVHLLVVGEGEFRELAALPGDSFTRVGWQPHSKMPEFVAAFDALPLTYQPGLPCYFSPLKLMEAMACGVVPLVPDLGDLARTVEHGASGYVYPAGDTRSMQELLAALILNPGQRKSLGRHAGEAATAYSWISIAASVLDRIAQCGAARSASG